MNLNIDFSESWYDEIIYKAIKAALEYENFNYDTELEVITASEQEIRELNNAE